MNYSFTVVPAVVVVFCVCPYARSSLTHCCADFYPVFVFSFTDLDMKRSSSPLVRRKLQPTDKTGENHVIAPAAQTTVASVLPNGASLLKIFEMKISE